MTNIVKPKTIIFYKDTAGREPFSKWIGDFRDPMTRRRIMQRVFRVETGNYGDYKSLKDGVLELRLDFGAGYRVYFGEDGDKIVILLCGGDKSTQEQDIERAKDYWKEYLSHA